MRKKKLFFQIFMACLMMSVLASCSSSRLASTWEGSSSFAAAGEKMMIAGVTEDLERRQLFEEAAAEKLGQKGIETVSSLSVLNSPEKPEKQELLEAAGNQGIKLVLIAKLEGIEKTCAVSPYDPGLIYRDIGNDPATLSKDQQRYVKDRYAQWVHVKLRTELYETDTGRMVWSDAPDAARPAREVSVRAMAEKAAEIIGRKLDSRSIRSS